MASSQTSTTTIRNSTSTSSSSISIQLRAEHAYHVRDDSNDAIELIQSPTHNTNIKGDIRDGENADLSLPTVPAPTVQRPSTSRNDTFSSEANPTTEPPSVEPSNIVSAIPDGGYGWTLVLACSIITFFFNGYSGSWGVIQTALLSSSLSTSSSATLSFVGSLGLACVTTFGLLTVRLMVYVGARVVAMAGVTLVFLGILLSGFTTENVGGLFVTSGVLFGIGSSFCYAVSNTMPTQYFSGRLGFANGLIKLGGGLGATCLAVTMEAMIQRVGVAWAFRIMGLITAALCLPAAWLVKERVPMRKGPFVDLDMLRNGPFVAILISGALVTFSLFVPPFFLPLFARSIGLSSSAGAGLVAGFNLCTALGRFGSGWLADLIGPVNTFLITMSLNAFSMLAIWPVSSSLPPLVVFAMLNGVANGTFFTTMPTVLGSMFGPGRAAVAMAMAITGWTSGYLMGAPIAGYLIQATGAENSKGIEPYRAAIFYAGGITFVATLFVLFARFRLDRRILQRV